MNFHSCLCLADNLMKLKDYSGAQQILDVIDKKWHRKRRILGEKNPVICRAEKWQGNSGSSETDERGAYLFVFKE